MLAGKPLIAWTIEAAQKAKRLTDYLVSSDALLIVDVAEKLRGAGSIYQAFGACDRYGSKH